MRPRRAHLPALFIAVPRQALDVGAQVGDVGDAGAEIEVLKLSGESDSITATVSLNVDERTAQVMVDRARKDYFEGREISYYIPKFFR